VPSYPVSRAYFNNVNVSNTRVNTTVINNYYTTVIVNKQVSVTNVTYVNQRVTGAVAATSSQAFSSGRPVSTNAVHMDARQIASASVTVRTPPTVPQRESVLGGRTTVNVRPPAAIQSRAVVVKTAPPPPAPSFDRRQAAIKSNGGQPLSIAETRKIEPARTQQAAAPRVKVAPPSKPGVPRTVSAAKPAPTAPPPPASNTQRPPAAHPVPDQLLKQHQQQSVDLHQKQDQQYQQLHEQQQKQLQELQAQKADEAKQKQIQQEHQRQSELLEQQHQQQQLQLQQKQEAEHQLLQKQEAERQQQALKAKPKPQEKPKPEEKPKPPLT
jgi:hypothetical protein